MRVRIGMDWQNHEKRPAFKPFGFFAGDGWMVAKCFKFGFVGLFVYVLFSPCREKSTKRAPLKESTHGTFLKDPIPLSARHFASGQNGQRAVKSQFAIEPHGRQSADRAVGCPFGGNPRFFVIRQVKKRLWAEAKRQVPRGRRSAVRAGYRVLATLRAVNFFRPLAKEVRAVG